MNDKKLSSLELLEQDVWFNFCYYYQCELDDGSITTENQSYIDKKGKILLKMQQNEFPVNEVVAFRQEMMGETIPFKPSQLAELLTQFNRLRGEVNNLSALMFQRQYSDILIAYVQLLGGLEFIKNQKLFRSARATLAVKARYDKHLYRRREIIYRILREQVVQRGKWNKLNQAVNFILDDLVKAFEVYDVEWLKSELALKKKMLRKLERESSSVKQQVKAESGSVRRKPASIAKKIKAIKKEHGQLEKIFKSKYPSIEMEKLGYKMPYSGVYLAETIIHELKNQPTILSEIIL